MKAPAGRVESVMDPVSESLAGVYADALLGQLPSDAEAEEVAAELDALVALLDGIEGFEELLTASLLTHEERCEVVQRVFRGRVGEPLEALLNVMAQAGRLGLLRWLRRMFRSALHRRQGKREVTIVTAAALDDEQRRHVGQSLGESLGAEVMVTYRVEPRLVGGMVVQVGDQVYDASVRGDLERLQERLGRDIRLDVTGGGADAADGET